jgi:hypothetical protein
VHLNSKGGWIEAAQNIGEIIRERRYTTVAHGRCSSACVFIWIAGTPRTFSKDGRVVAHCAVLEGETNCNQAAKARVESYLRRMQAPEELIRYQNFAFEAGADKTVPAPSDMDGLVTREVVPLPRSRPTSHIAAASLPQHISRPYCPLIGLLTLGAICF